MWAQGGTETHLEPVVPVSHERIPDAHRSGREGCLEPQMRLLSEDMLGKVLLLYRVRLRVSLRTDQRSQRLTSGSHPPSTSHSFTTSSTACPLPRDAFSSPRSDRLIPGVILRVSTPFLSGWMLPTARRYSAP